MCVKWIINGCAMFLLFPLGLAVVAQDDPGKEAFLNNKCNKCHSVDSLGIKKEANDDGKEAKGPDLSKVGVDHDQEWFTKWLRREVEEKNENGEMKKHKKIYKGSDEDLQSIVSFLTARTS